MRPTFVYGAALAAFTVAACGGAKKAEPPPAPPTIQAPALPSDVPSSAPPRGATALDSKMAIRAAPDTMKCAGADSVKCAAEVDSTKRAAAKQADTRLRDSAFGPKFTVDSTGKVTPIKPPPPKEP